MSRLRARGTLAGLIAVLMAGLTVVLAVASVGPAYAGPDGEFADSPSPGIPGWFVGLFVLVLVAGVATTVWKVTTAQKLAQQSGMDPGLATQVTLLSDDGLDATYLAASLRQPAAPSSPAVPETPVPAGTSAEARLAELRGLLDKGLITQAEYDERRTAIIGSV